MFSPPSDFEHSASTLSEIENTLRAHGADRAVLKMLPKNANDKNQVYWANSFSSLYNNFDLTLSERGASTSLTKDRSTPGTCIPEAVFNDFSWVKRSGVRVKAKNVKVIVYTQYPEARLSGFLTVENTMPQSLAIEFTKKNPKSNRLLVLARLPGGSCLAFVYLGVENDLEAEVRNLPGLEGSKVCKLLNLNLGLSEKLFTQLAKVVSGPLKGCRLDRYGNTLPFSGTQVCGYTLEHALGIVPNSDKDGDLYGIELKTHTQVKVTLFTPEPDFGLYVEGFEKFMRKYGYENDGEDGAKEWRLTGVHKAGKRSAKSGLTLQVREYHVAGLENSKSDWVREPDGSRTPFPYDSATSLTSKLNAVEVVLVDDHGFIAAGWSLERLMNNWGVKHNEVVYLSASKFENDNEEEFNAGFEYKVSFAPKVHWCRDTSAERLLDAIDKGVIFLDPAPKFVPNDPSKNKRRAQWRVNDISTAVKVLYERTEWRNLN